MISLSRFSKRENIPVSSPDIMSIFSPKTSKAGVSVTQDTAMRHTTVYSCYNVLAEGVASLPLHLMVRKKEGKRNIVKRATEHKLYDILHTQPHDEITSFNWVYSMMLNLVSRGEAYSQIIRNRRGDVIAIYPLLTDNMQKVRNRDTGELGYIYTPSSGGGRTFLTSHEIVRVIGTTIDGVNGVSPIQANANAIGLSIAMEEFGSNFFKNGANASGAFSTPGELSDEAYTRLKNDLYKNYAGLMQSGKPMLLEGGLTFERISIPNNDAQFLESRKYQRSEIASIFKVPLHMINDLDKSSFNNMEQQSLDFVIHTLRPWVLRIEQALTSSLFGVGSEYFVRLNMAALLRGDTKTRYEAYGTGIRDGWLTRNEAREKEDLNPLDGLDEPILPLNMEKQGDDNA
jgi:HK97 family phage portal protein